jgi:hypothetical protein
MHPSSKSQLVIALVAFAATTAGALANDNSYTTSWIGNTWGRADMEWVQNQVLDMHVMPDGTCFTQSMWDECAREGGVYKDGDVLQNYDFDIHRYGGGKAVTANGTYVWHAVAWNKGHIKRVKYGDGKPAPFAAGGGHNKDVLEKAGTDCISGLASTADKLFAADSGSQKIKVYDAVAMTPIQEWAVPRPGQMTIDTKGNLWVISKGDKVNKPRILRFTQTGVKLMQEITGLPDPRGLAIDSKGRLVVGVNGERQQVCFFSNIDSTPKPDSAFGDAGGLTGGAAPGVVTPKKFLNITAVGADAAGNLYVAFTGHDTDVGAGTVLRSFDSSGKMNWEVLGLAFVDVAAVDPFSDGADVYTKQEHFSMDYSKPPGKEAAWKGYTLDSVTYPGDWRDQRYHHMYAWEMRRVSGKKFLYTSDMDFAHLGVVRFANDSGSRDEVAIPCANLSEGDGIWVDANGDGKQDAFEYTKPFEPNHKMHGKFVDENGGLWIAVESRKIHYIPCDGVDRNGVPMFDLPGKKSWDVSADFTVLGRVAYIASTDTLYVGGFTGDHPVSGHYGCFQVIKKYQGLLEKGTLPVGQWSVVATDNSLGKSMYADEQYVFFCRVRDPGHVKCFSAIDGSLVQTLAPGPEVGSTQGWIDIGNGLNAFRRSNGEYLVFQEEDAFAKVLMYRWQAPRTAGAVPAAPIGLRATAIASGRVTLEWTDASDSEWGFRVERRTGTGGGFVQVGIARGNSGTYTCKDLLPGTPYAFRVRSYNAAGASSHSNEAQTTTLAEPTVVLTAPTANQAFGGPATVTITANASAPGAGISKVEFFRGATKLGEDGSPPYAYEWANAAVGHCLITAKAICSNGDVAESIPVSITITGDQILAGVLFGDPGWQNAEHTKKENNWNPGPEAAFDGDINTFANGGHSGTVFGIDLGVDNEAAITKIRFHPRVSVPGRINGGEFQGSNDGIRYATLATIQGNSAAQWYETTPVDTTTAYRYLRYVAPNGGYGNIAEIEFHHHLMVVNQAPLCELNSPASGKSHPYGSVVRLAAIASDPGGSVAMVRFFDGKSLLASDFTAPYTLDLLNRGVGTRSLTARAYDNHGAVTVSKPIVFTINQAAVTTPAR